MKKNARRFGMGSISGGALACAAFLVAACGEDEVPTPTEPGTEPQYLIHSAVQTGDTRMNYFTLVDSLDQATRLDYTNSLELPGRPRLYAAQGIGFFAIGGGEAPTITRYELKDGRLVAGSSISLAAQGVRAMGAQAVLFISPTKAYYKDDAQAQIIVWNPTEMVIVKTLPLPRELVKQGYVTSLSQWASRTGEAFFTVGWTTTTYDRVLPGTVLVRLDTTTDELTQVSDERCRDIFKTAKLGDTLYFFSGVINGLGHTAYSSQNGGQQDCILRITPGQRTFDANYLGTVAPALGANKVGTVIAVTEDGKAWVQVADTTITPSAPGTTYSEWYSKGWSWWSLPLESLTSPARVQAEPGAYSGFAASTGESFFISQSSLDYSVSTLTELSSGTPKAGVSFPGFVLDVARVR
ncbi:MxcI [Pyxidicoccus trucidator]|uniref:MxcI n=1 Tax=Pyxidicoccus trucidator TaxID=2709662 RepID=UPI0013DBEF27|nr:MxcI [Pyxidicoccus trucidator]